MILYQQILNLPQKFHHGKLNHWHLFSVCNYQHGKGLHSAIPFGSNCVVCKHVAVAKVSNSLTRDVDSTK